MRLINLRTGVVIAGDVGEAAGFLGRLKGLIGKNSMPPGSALVLKPCKWVHTFFMRFNTDVLFLDHRGKVVHLIHEMPPSRVSPIVRGAAAAVELPGGFVFGKVTPGDVLMMEGDVLSRGH